MKKIKFNWQCIHCGKRNIEEFSFQFDIPKQYSSVWTCSKCNKKTLVIFTFSIELPKDQGAP